MLPAWAIRRVLNDPRNIPYLLLWKSHRTGEIKEAIRVVRRTFGAPPYSIEKVELKRTDASVVYICPVWRPLPRGSGRSLLLGCPHCGRLCRALYGAKVGNDGRFYAVRRANWECRTCAQLRYSSEGGALLIRPGRTLSWLLELPDVRAPTVGVFRVQFPRSCVLAFAERKEGQSRPEAHGRKRVIMIQAENSVSGSA